MTYEAHEYACSANPRFPSLSSLALVSASRLAPEVRSSRTYLAADLLFLNQLADQVNWSGALLYYCTIYCEFADSATDSRLAKRDEENVEYSEVQDGNI